MDNGTLLKGYELHERIGSGGFGVVHRAYQSTVGREVAIKIILPKFANQPNFIRRFETEAQLVARLEHPFIVPLIDYWRDPDGAYLVMRYLRGGSLRDAIKNDGAFEPESAARVLNQITSALALAHRQSVIHRDLKPGNILLDEDDYTYLGDFGIAKDLANGNGSMTAPDMLVGSPDYLAPEQARSQPVAPQTDIYSLGVVLYEMLAGQHPFPNLTPVERMYKHLNEPLPELTNLRPEIVDAVNEVIQKATAKNPVHRYADTLEFAAAFRDAADIDRPYADDSIVEQLTRREQEILSLIVQDKSNAEIAQDLFLTVSTVKWHIRQLYKKLRVRNRVQAIIRARELDLIFGDMTAEAIPAAPAVTYTPLPEAENPYKGLRAFQAADARDFFGREALTDKLICRMGEKHDLARFQAVIGPSGSGKSSLVKAGLIPALLKGSLPGSDRWYVVDMMPGDRPLDKLEVALTRIAADQAANLHDHLSRDDHGLVRIADLILPNDGTELVVVIDQFEEVFTLVEDEDTRGQFLDLIYTAVTASRSRVRIVTTMRADFYDRPLHYPTFGELMRDRGETVLPLSAEELERAIVKPAEHVGVTFEEGLVATIIDEALYQPGALPLLQYALTELFERRDGRTLTRASYQAIGGTVGALAKRADELYADYDAAGREAIRQMFLRLVTLGEGTEDTRRRVARSELIAIADDADLMDDVIAAFADYRLLAMDHDPATRTPTVEVAHEAILREWERLRFWLNDSRDDIKQQRQLANLTAEWRAHAQDASYLVHGTRLEQFQLWAANTELSLTPSERDFLAASIAAEMEREAQEQAQIERETRLRRQRQRVLQGLVAVLLVAAILSGGFGLYALDQRDSAVAALDVAQRSGLAFAANSALELGEIDLSLALSMESVGDNEANMLSETRGIIERLADSAGPGAQLNTVPWCGRMFSGNSLDDRIWLVAECDSDNMLTFDSEKRKRIASAPFASIAGDATSYAGVSPDNQFFAMAVSPWYKESIQVGVWKTEDFSQIASFEIDVPIIALRWSWDSATLVTIDMLPENLDLAREQSIEIGGGISFWDIESGELVRHLEIDAPYYHTLNFSHDGRIGIVGGWSSSEDDKQYQVTVFDTETGATLHQFERPALFQPADDPFGAGEVGFNPDDSIVWFGGYPGYAITLATGETYGHMHEFVPETSRLPNDDAYFNYAAANHEQRMSERVFNPDPNFNYVTSLGGNEYRIFNVHSGDTITYGTFAYMAPTTIQDRFVATYYGRTRNFYLWDISGRDDLVKSIPEEGTFGFFPYGSFSPDGRYLGIVSAPYGLVSGSVSTVYHAGTLDVAYHLDTEFNLSYDLEWSPDSRYLATIMTVDIVELPDGKKLGYQNVVLWDAETGAEVRRFAYNDEQIPLTQVEFTPDGRYLVTGRHSRATSNMKAGNPYLLMFDVESGELVKRIDMPATSDPNYGIHWLQMHPARNQVYVTVNSDFLASGDLLGISGDRFAPYLVDLDTGEIQRIENDFLPYNAEFTPDGTQLVFSSFSDNRVRIYDIETRRFVREWVSDQAGISALSVSPDGRTVITPSSILASDPIVNLWDFESGELIRRFTGHDPETFLIGTEFQPDGQRFLSAAIDGTVRVWTFNHQLALDWIRENRYIRDLTCAEREIYRVEPLCDQ